MNERMRLEFEADEFPARVRAALADERTRANVKRATASFLASRQHAQNATPNWEELRERAHALKKTVIENLDSYLGHFEAAVAARGGEVHHAADAQQARDIVLELAHAHGVTRVIKSKSMVSEEIELNHALEAAGIAAVETDLGEYIVQVAGERPSHIVGPVIHKNRHDIAEVFRSRLGYSGDDEPTAMTAHARGLLRQAFLGAQMGISGANFAVAETGSIVLVENEGNIRMTTTLPRLHVALVGIEKLIPAIDDLAVFLRLLPGSGAGQRLTVYVSLITGARRQSTDEGPEELHVVLVDNGRRRMQADEKLQEALYCIRCGACLNACPVYQRIGGHAYGSIYSGPIGSVITPSLVGTTAASHLAFASSLCGACKDVCPVKINLPELLLHVRAQSKVADFAPREHHEQKHSPRASEGRGERVGMALWARAMRSQRGYQRMTAAARALQRLLGRKRLQKMPVPPLRQWTVTRDFPPLAAESFRQWWTESHHPIVEQSAPVVIRSAAVDSPLQPGGKGENVPASPGAPLRCASDGDVIEAFQTEFERLNGKFLRATSASDILAFVVAGIPPGSVIALSDSVLLERLGIADGLRERGFEVITPDLPSYTERLPQAAAGITGAFAAMASTGTLVLAGAEKSRRASLLPPVHIAIVKQERICRDWEDLLHTIDHAGPLPQAVTFITGPSRTADIELTLCVGVHGPGEVRAVVLG